MGHPIIHRIFITVKVYLFNHKTQSLYVITTSPKLRENGIYILCYFIISHMCPFEVRNNDYDY